jgi:hypothetical protein
MYLEILIIEMEGKAVFINDIKLSGDSDFVKRFNDCSDAWARSNDESLTEQEREEAYQEWFHKKQCLELGIG